MEIESRYQANRRIRELAQAKRARDHATTTEVQRAADTILSAGVIEHVVVWTRDGVTHHKTTFERVQ